MTGTPLDSEPDRIESAILELLTTPEGQRHWSLEELSREVTSPVRVSDAIASLHRAGLVHRTGDGFVFATRAAIRASELTS